MKNKIYMLVMLVLENLDSLCTKDCCTLFLLIKRFFSSWLVVLWSKTYVFNKGWFIGDVTRLFHHCYSPQRWIFVGYLNCTLKRNLWAENWELLCHDLYLIWEYFWTVIILVLWVKSCGNSLVKVGKVWNYRRWNVAKGCNIMLPICMLCRIAKCSILWAVIRILRH